VVYKKIPYKIELKDAVVVVVRIFYCCPSLCLHKLQAMQRISDSWRATIGSTSVTIINCVFENDPDDFSTDDDRQDFANRQLDTLEFLYGDTKAEVQTFILFIYRRLITVEPSRTVIFFEDRSFCTPLQLTIVLFAAPSKFSPWEILISFLISPMVLWPYQPQQFVSFYCQSVTMCS
jgi:hypothetical protein